MLSEPGLLRGQHLYRLPSILRCSPDNKPQVIDITVSVKRNNGSFFLVSDVGVAALRKTAILRKIDGGLMTQGGFVVVR
jgi:hypothetical protein